MAFTIPVSRPTQPTYNAGSGLRSPLDKDDLTNQHKKTNVVKGSTFNLAVQVQQHSVMINKLRRRIVSPPGLGSAGGGLNPRGEYDASGATQYNYLDMVVVRAGSNAGTFYAIQNVPAATGTQPIPTCPDTGNQFWICISNSPPLGQWM